MLNSMKYPENKYINKYKLHIFDNRFSTLGLLLCLPILYFENRILRHKYSNTIVIIVLVVTDIILSSIFAQLIGNWWYKRQVKKVKNRSYYP